MEIVKLKTAIFARVGRTGKIGSLDLSTINGSQLAEALEWVYSSLFGLLKKIIRVQTLS
ncbi:hypothetical protein MNBD_ALPHA04-359 [hydrothermal vent metagenome]|uniref:Uncharacterized protein n=1 Tax=hydrothermal vent metagenome TaxID=652676 RepID=A0A3B0SDK5_9ZZZZ